MLKTSMIRRRQLLLLAGLGLGGLLLSKVALAQTYVNPSTSFTGPVAPAINSSLNDQRKLGSLGVGRAVNPQKFCLNATSLADATNCISSWSDLSGQFGGPFVSLSQDAWTLATPSSACGAGTPKSLCTGDYASQSGFVHVQASSLTTPQQAFSTIVQGPNLQLCDYPRNGSKTPGHCIAGSPMAGQSCFFNNDCGYRSTAIYGNDGSPTNAQNAAGYFSGVVYVTSPTSDPLLPKGRICLNGATEDYFNDVPGGTCITSWSELGASGSGTYVKRQQGTPILQNPGAVISGVIVMSSATTGSTDGLPSTFTCGDSFCNATAVPPETAASCPIDCFAIPTPQLSVAIASDKVNMTITTKTQQPAGPVNIIVVRSVGLTSSFVPVNGVAYTIGETIGSDIIVYAGSATQNNTFVQQDTTLPGAGTYSYRAYQANSYPRYGGPADAPLGQIYKLQTSVSPNGSAFISSNDGQIVHCSASSGTGCVAYYLSSNTPTVVISFDSIVTTNTFNGWTGCNSTGGSGAGSTCTVIMSTNKSIVASFSSGGPKGCFTGSTLVDTPAGPRPIVDLRAGDDVFTYDQATGQTVVSPILRTFVHSDQAYGVVTFTDGTTINVTSIHPFYDARWKMWREIGHMRPGDIVLQGRGLSARPIRIVSLEFSSGQGTVYNIEVGGHHSYYVNGILVHNKGREG